jgi:hypothetical protein
VGRCAKLYGVPGTVASTTRTTLELLDLPFPFSQAPLLDSVRFISEVKQRRITLPGGRDLDQTGLEELHRQGILVPFFCVSIADQPARSEIDVSESLTARYVHTTLIAEMYSAAAGGRLTDPAAQPFAPWPSERLRVLWPSVERGYLYSYHQLLTLDLAQSFVRSLRLRRLALHRFEQYLPPEDHPDQRLREEFDASRQFAITLAAIDTRVWPAIMQTVHHTVEGWRASNLAVTPDQLLTWLGVTPDQLRRQSEHLRLKASFTDVLGDFYDVIRRARPKAWETLQGEARRSMDYRVAAEALDRFADETTGAATGGAAMAQESLSHQGLGHRPQSLDRTLSDLHLSPHPPLVVALEGKTEMTLLPKVLRLLGSTVDPAWMRFVDFEGTLNLSLLARHAVEPQLGTDHGEFVMLDRPVSRFLVLTDAENKFATPAKRAHQRRLLLDSITKDLPEDLRPDIYSRQARIVEILTWGKYPFEFAHFSDRQIADGLLALAGAAYPDGRTGLVARVAAERASTTPNVEDVWRTASISNVKVSLANQLWPVLAERVETAIRRGTAGPPIMKAAVRAYELAMLSYRVNTSLRRRTSSTGRKA